MYVTTYTCVRTPNYKPISGVELLAKLNAYQKPNAMLLIVYQYKSSDVADTRFNVLHYLQEGSHALILYSGGGC